MVNNFNLPDDNIWLQQDGASPHYARDIRIFFKAVFPGRWIGR